MNKSHHTEGLFQKLLSRLGLFLSLCALNACAFLTDPMSTFDAQGPIARSQLNVFWWSIGLSFFLLIAVGGIFFYAIFKFKAKPGQEHLIPEQSHGSTAIEAGLIVVSTLLLLFIIIPNLNSLWLMDAIPESEKNGKEPIEVIAIGHQWWWEFQYPKLGITTANEMHIPAGVPISIKLKSVDVIHSFWVPKLAGKLDVMPGQINWLWLKADQPGEYYGHCVEFCGEAHAYMRFMVHSDTPEAWTQWVDNEKADSTKPKEALAINGKEVFMNGCNACHTVKGTMAAGVIGPNLSHIADRKTLAAGIFEKTDANLYAWLKNPQAMKQGNLMNVASMNLTDRDITALVAYLKSLK